MNFERISEKKIKYDNNKSKISSVTLSSYEKDFELRFTHNSTKYAYPYGNEIGPGGRRLCRRQGAL